MVYDRTDDARILIPRIVRRTDGTAAGTGGLSKFWRLGGVYHRAALRAHAVFGATSWHEALGFAATTAETMSRPIDELQFWGHGGFGFMLMDEEPLSAHSIQDQHSALVHRLKAQLRPSSLVWFRCCSAFGSADGKHFAKRMAAALGAGIAGHTHIIGFFQSGLHLLRPFAEPHWSDDEGVERNAQGAAQGARESSIRGPNTITALRMGLPRWAAAEGQATSPTPARGNGNGAP